jgi:murein DD-endopeptidase MepM/ murein hydrolase activator NlpD
MSASLPGFAVWVTYCMKPSRWILPLLLTTPAIAPLLSAIADNSRSAPDSSSLLLATLPPLPQELTWVAVAESVTIEELSSQLSMDESRLARLNKVDEDHRFDRGEWVALPSRSGSSLSQIASIDATSARSIPPQQVRRLPFTSSGVIRLGDTIGEIARRYGMTIAELLRLNPGLESARLVVGSQVRLAQSAPIPVLRPVLGLNPVGSGGTSWPETPRFEPGQGFEGPRSTAFIWPTDGVFTSGYGWRWGRMHKGIDVANSVGTPIRAVQDGQVSFAGWDDGGYGYLVKITHADGTITIYAHNSRILVQTGEFVRQGQNISLMGSTGRSTGPHLHFEVRPAGSSAVNPMQFLPPRA